jgi:predicted AAA+ superfamily ATPase
MGYVKRAAETKVIELSKHFPIVLITGPRQVGKTTMLKVLAEEKRNYISLDDPIARNLAISDPALFLQRYNPPVIIDEIQYVPQILPYIKMYVDEHKANGNFWLTGSQMFHTMKGVSESLAGRMGILNMPGLSYSEIISSKTIPFTTSSIDNLMEKNNNRKKLSLREIYYLILKGGMPALYNDEQSLEDFFASYMNTYLQRDIKDLTQVGNEMSFLKFVTSAAARTGQLLNLSDMSRDAEITVTTARNWLSILVSSGIVYLLEPYYNNALKRLVKTPKLYFLDTGLCAYLTRWLTSEALEAGAMAGEFFETWVVSEIIKSYYNAGKRPPLYYYRDKDQVEIDLIIIENGALYPIEIKKSANPGTQAAKNFKALEKTGQPTGTGGVICMYPDLLPIDKNNWYIPAWLI